MASYFTSRLTERVSPTDPKVIGIAGYKINAEKDSKEIRREECDQTFCLPGGRQPYHGELRSRRSSCRPACCAARTLLRKVDNLNCFIIRDGKRSRRVLMNSMMRIMHCVSCRVGRIEGEVDFCRFHSDSSTSTPAASILRTSQNTIHNS